MAQTQPIRSGSEFCSQTLAKPLSVTMTIAATKKPEESTIGIAQAFPQALHRAGEDDHDNHLCRYEIVLWWHDGQTYMVEVTRWLFDESLTN